nr:hypothetical protein M176.9 - Caenorhabditis elegans [Caenorhabditis elegans]
MAGSLQATLQPTEKSARGKSSRRKKKKPQCTAPEEKSLMTSDREYFPVLEKTLRGFKFYHGFLPREDLQATLHNPGDYLIRVSEVVEGESKVVREIILSLMTGHMEGKQKEKRIHNVVIKRVSNKFFCEAARPFATVADLINYYTKHTGHCSSGNFQLKHPILQQTWEFMHSDVTVGDVLGEGAFGKVCAGELRLKDGSSAEVAIKMTKASAFLSKMKIKEMMNEARFIRNFNHKNVVRLYGVAHDEQPLYILLELVKGGSLQDYMKQTKSVPLADRINFCLGAAKGLAYLHQNNCIHRDIAARNCLLHENEVKITDFGLSRAGPSYTTKTSCKIPIKWLAPETLATLSFSYATDVYSWGVTCYEVFVDGAEPFEGVSNATIKADIMANNFYPMPSMTPDEVKEYMSSCIFVEESRRATIPLAVAEFERFARMCEDGTLQMGKAKNRLLAVFKNNSDRSRKSQRSKRTKKKKEVPKEE